MGFPFTISGAPKSRVNNSLFGAFQRSSEEYFSAKGETSQPLISEDLQVLEKIW